MASGVGARDLRRCLCALRGMAGLILTHGRMRDASFLSLSVRAAQRCCAHGCLSFKLTCNTLLSHAEPRGET